MSGADANRSGDAKVVVAKISQPEVEADSKPKRPKRPIVITLCAGFFLVAGAGFVLVATLGGFPQGFEGRPLFGLRMTASTFRLYGAIIGISLLWLAYAFWNLWPSGLVIFALATLIGALSNLLNLNWARAIVLVVDLGFLGFILSYWRAFFEKSK